MKRQEILKIKLNTIKNWGARIKASGKSISEVSRLSKVNRATIHNALNGSRLPNLTTINKVEDILNEKPNNN